MKQRRYVGNMLGQHHLRLDCSIAKKTQLIHADLLLLLLY